MEKIGGKAQNTHFSFITTSEVPFSKAFNVTQTSHPTPAASVELLNDGSF